MHVTVVGGGLAGMIAALRLAERGFAVDLYEASQRLGGKAGADHSKPDFDEHGYHIFPMWYRNIWKLVDELGIGENFADVEDFLQLERGSYPAFKKLTSLGSPNGSCATKSGPPSPCRRSKNSPPGRRPPCSDSLQRPPGKADRTSARFS